MQAIRTRWMFALAPIGVLAACSQDDDSKPTAETIAVVEATAAPTPPPPSALPVPPAFIPSDRPPAPVGNAAPQFKTSAKPNILFIVSDDLRPELGAYGSRVAKTPNMDALAASGAVFENAFVSEAACAPSRASFMTGLRPDTLGITGGTDTLAQFAPAVPTIGDIFRDGGYDNYRIGKVYHVVNDDPDGFRTINSAPIEYTDANYFNATTMRWPSRQTTADYQNAVTAANSIRKLAKGGADKKPFFWAVGIMRPHLPLVAPVEDWDKYNGVTFPPPINPTGQAGAFSWSLINSEIFQFKDVQAYSPTMPANKARDITWGYLAAVSSVDYNVGVLMQALKDAGIENNTIVVLLGDHGFKLGDHGNYWTKQSNASIDIRIPLILSAPGRVAPGIRVSGIVEAVDILPTLAEMAGIPRPDNLEGKSFTDLFRKPSLNWKVAAFAQYPRYAYEMGGRADMMGYTVRTATYRYTTWLRRSDNAMAGRELYDLVNDPQESTNVATNVNYRSVLNTLEQVRIGGWKPVRDALPKSTPI